MAKNRSCRFAGWVEFGGEKPSYPGTNITDNPLRHLKVWHKNNILFVLLHDDIKQAGRMKGKDRNLQLSMCRSPNFKIIV